MLTDTQLEVAVTAGDDVTVESVTVELDSDNNDGFYITYDIGDCQYGVNLIRLGVGSITQQTGKTMTIISFFSVIKRKVIAVKTCHAPTPFIKKSVMHLNRHIDLFPATQHWKYGSPI